jgi:AraC-like DNA-binding protein
MINMLQGKKVMHLDNVKAFDYLPGEMMMLPAYMGMEIDFPEAAQDAPTQCTALTVRKEKIDEVLNYLNEFYPKHHMVGEWNLNPDMFHLYNTPELTALINKLFQIILSNDPLKSVLADLTFKELTIKLLQTQSLLALDISVERNSSVLPYLKEFIRKHLSEPITIEMLEIKANMSRSSLFRLFKTALGISPFEYIIRERIHKAKDILLKTRNIKEACFSAGFNDVNYFTRLFKKRVGLTPGAFILAQ